VEQARKLEPGSIMRGITSCLSAWPRQGDPAQLALQAKLVDGLKTRDQMRELLIERGARDAASKSFRQIGLGDYLARLPQDSGPAAIAVVVAEGEIVDGSTGPGRIGGDSTAA
jgi:protease-4